MNESMFKHYPQPEDYVPNNRRVFIPIKPITIMAGETAEHSFEILDSLKSFSMDEIDYEAIYKLGLDVVLIKGKDECKVTTDCHGHIVIMIWILDPEETSLFRDTLLDAKVQLKFTLPDNTIMFSDIMNIKLENALHNTYTPTPQFNNGFGWTED